jgi:hypothetical protein
VARKKVETSWLASNSAFVQTPLPEALFHLPTCAEGSECVTVYVRMCVYICGGCLGEKSEVKEISTEPENLPQISYSEKCMISTQSS